MPPRLLRRLPRFPSSATATSLNTYNLSLSLNGKHGCRASATRFSTATTSLYAAAGREPTYYEVLDVPVTASTAEIKKYVFQTSLRAPSPGILFISLYMW